MIEKFKSLDVFAKWFLGTGLVLLLLTNILIPYSDTQFYTYHCGDQAMILKKIMSGVFGFFSRAGVSLLTAVIVAKIADAISDKLSAKTKDCFSNNFADAPGKLIQIGSMSQEWGWKNYFKVFVKTNIAEAIKAGLTTISIVLLVPLVIGGMGLTLGMAPDKSCELPVLANVSSILGCIFGLSCFILLTIVSYAKIANTISVKLDRFKNRLEESIINSIDANTPIEVTFNTGKYVEIKRLIDELIQHKFGEFNPSDNVGYFNTVMQCHILGLNYSNNFLTIHYNKGKLIVKIVGVINNEYKVEHPEITMNNLAELIMLL